MFDNSKGIDSITTSSSTGITERINWKPKWKIDKYENQNDYENGIIGETLEFDGNLLLNEGINALLHLLIGDGTVTPYDNANAQIGVGDSTTAEAATQVDLQAATNKLYVPMNTGYPTVSNQTVNFAATFGSDQANWAWNEITVQNSATSALNLNRKVSNMGTKVSPAVWAVTLSVTLS